jgi:hypothetical protein
MVLALPIVGVGTPPERAPKPGGTMRHTIMSPLVLCALALACESNPVGPVTFPYPTILDPRFGDGAVETAAVDYLLAYWMGRYYGVIGQ